MIVRFIEFTIPFMVIELDSFDLSKILAYDWLIVDFVEMDDESDWVKFNGLKFG